MKAPKAALGRQRPHAGSEGCTKAARPARGVAPATRRQQGLHIGGEARIKAARAARKRRRPDEGGEGRMKAARAA